MKKTHTKLANGLTVATIEMPGFETVALGAFIGVGSRYEPVNLNGISHMAEHMAFKGTQKRTAYDIAYEVERVGADINAFTSKDTTAYYVISLAQHTELALDIISDVLLNSTFPQDELDRERGVILQEIAQSYDNPSGLAWDLYDTVAYPNQDFGRTILGNPEVIKTATREDFQGYMKAHYTAENIIVVASGKVKHEEFVALVERYFAGLPTGARAKATPANYVGGYNHYNKDFEQANVILGFPTVDVFSPDSYAYCVMSQVLGGGMSSPLFTEIREKRGLVYSVGAYINLDDDHGDFYIYAGTTAEHLSELLSVAVDEVKKITDEVNPADIERAKNQFKSSLFMSLERPFSLARSYVSNLSTYGRDIPLEEVVQKIDAVTADDIRRVASTMLTKTPTLQLVGSIGNDDYYEIVKRKLV